MLQFVHLPNTIWCYRSEAWILNQLAHLNSRSNLWHHWIFISTKYSYTSTLLQKVRKNRKHVRKLILTLVINNLIVSFSLAWKTCNVSMDSFLNMVLVETVHYLIINTHVVSIYPMPHQPMQEHNFAVIDVDACSLIEAFCCLKDVYGVLDSKA